MSSKPKAARVEVEGWETKHVTVTSHFSKGSPYIGVPKTWFGRKAIVILLEPPAERASRKKAAQ